MADTVVSSRGEAGVRGQYTHKIRSFVGVPGNGLPSGYFHAVVTISMRVNGNNVEVKMDSGSFDQYHFTNVGGYPWFFQGLYASLQNFSIRIDGGGQHISVNPNAKLGNGGRLNMGQFGNYCSPSFGIPSTGWKVLGPVDRFISSVSNTVLTVYVCGAVTYGGTVTDPITIPAFPLRLTGNWPDLFWYFAGETCKGSHIGSKDVFGGPNSISFNRKKGNSIDGQAGYVWRMERNGTWGERKNKPNNYNESNVFTCTSHTPCGNKSDQSVWYQAEQSGNMG